jgi:enoyl-CoA hydratase/carnithine racemase
MGKLMKTQIKIEQKGRLAELILVPPDGKPPTLDGTVLDELEQAIQQIEKNLPSAVLLRSASDKYFCVGADLTALRTLSAERMSAWVHHGHRVFNRLEDLACPVIARVTGYAMGGGLELAMATDCIAASTTAVLAQSEAALGVVPGWGGTFRLAERIGSARAGMLFYSARRLSGEEAFRWGLVDLLAEPGKLDSSLAGLLDDILATEPAACSAFKRMSNQQRVDARRACAEEETDASEFCFRNPGTLERIDRFLNR